MAPVRGSWVLWSRSTANPRSARQIRRAAPLFSEQDGHSGAHPGAETRENCCKSAARVARWRNRNPGFLRCRRPIRGRPGGSAHGVQAVGGVERRCSTGFPAPARVDAPTDDGARGWRCASAPIAGGLVALTAAVLLVGVAGLSASIPGVAVPGNPTTGSARLGAPAGGDVGGDVGRGRSAQPRLVRRRLAGLRVDAPDRCR